MARLKTQSLTSSQHKTRILVIEDDSEMAHEISLALQTQGYEVRVFDDPSAGFTAARSGSVGVMIVDRMLYGKDSLRMVVGLREDGVQIPILFVSALTSTEDRVNGLCVGGDDYVVKPFSMKELIARVEALLRRSPTMLRQVFFQTGQLKIDLVEKKAWRGNRELSLLPQEFKLLEYMMRHPDQILTRAMLLENVWNYSFLQTNLVDVHMGKLRRKVDGPGEESLIKSIRLTGFMLHAAD